MSGPRHPPADVPAEESLLGCLLLDRKSVDELMNGEIDAQDFYKPRHKMIFSAMQMLRSVDAPIDAVTVSGELDRCGLLQEIGGSSVLLELQNAAPSISNGRRYAKRVVDTSLMRQAIQAAADIADNAYDQPDDVEQFLDWSRGKLAEVVYTGGQAANMDGFYESIHDMPHTEQKHWVGEGLLCKGEVLMCTAGGGLGKSTLGRWFAFAIENGVHPWFPRRAETVGFQRTLVVDLETQPWNIKESAGIFINKIAHIIGCEMDEVYQPAILQRRGRLDLRKRPNRATLREALRRVQPNFVVMGPLKNMLLEDQNESYAQAALETQEILMGLMEEFGFALYLEAHGSKGSKHQTAGSQRWEDWPDMSIGLEQADEDAPPSKDRAYNEALTEFCEHRNAGEMALKVIRNREPRNSGMILPKLLIRSAHRSVPFTIATA